MPDHVLDYKGRAAYSPDVVATCTCGAWRYQANATHNALQETTAFAGYELGIKVSQAFTRHLGAEILRDVRPGTVVPHVMWSKLADWNTRGY